MNQRTLELSEGVCSALRIRESAEAVDWLSPLEGRGFREYKDADFLRVIGREDGVEALRKFWPKGGPVWDGLARVRRDFTARPPIILVEAKSYPREVHGRGCLATPGGEARAMIERALDRTAHWLGVQRTAAWTGRLYQSANRLAHLYFLREELGVDAHLVNVCFVDDPRRRTSVEEWQRANVAFKRELGIELVKLPWLTSIAVLAEPRAVDGRGHSFVPRLQDDDPVQCWPTAANGPIGQRRSRESYPNYMAPDTCVGEDLLREFDTTGHAPEGLDRIIHALGDGPLGQALFLHPIQDEDFDPEHIADCELPDSRIDALFEGASPTEAELRLWRGKRRDHALTGDGDGWNPAALYRVVADDGVVFYAVALHEDGGSFENVFGPFRSAAAALADLQRRGEVLEIEWLADEP